MTVWRIMHRLTGWDYVHMELDPHGHSEVRRVRYTAAGRAYIVWYGAHYVWLDHPGDWIITPLTTRTQTAN